MITASRTRVLGTFSFSTTMEVCSLFVASYSLGITPSLEESFFVGDAAGRKGDHDDCDKKFAETIGVKFHTDNEFFKVKAKAEKK